MYEIAKKYNRPIRIVVMNVPLRQILEQNSKRERKVPEEVIKKMFKNLAEQIEEISEEVRQLPDAKQCMVYVVPQKEDTKKDINNDDSDERSNI